MKRVQYAISFLCVLLWGCTSLGKTDNGEIVSQKLNRSGDGYTVIRLWGSDYEMGYAQGALLAEDILSIVRLARVTQGSSYERIKAEIAKTSWGDPAIEEEIRGLVAGIKSVKPKSKVTVEDIKVINTYGDWAASGPLCRSHSCWGSRVSDSTVALSSRRLDYATPEILPNLHHVIAIREPKNGKRWVNFAFAGYVAVFTALDEDGTMVSLHDFHSYGDPATGRKVMTRSAAARYLMTADSLPVKSAKIVHELEKRLRSYDFWTGSFINYFRADGHGAVFTGNQSRGLYKTRKPQKSYFDGEVLVTTNNETNGRVTPLGADYIEDYYWDSTVKTLETHWNLLTENLLDGYGLPLHQVGMEKKRSGNIEIWFQGRNRLNDTLPRMKLTL